MSKFYIKDGSSIRYVNSVPEVVQLLENGVKVKTNMNRFEWMQHVFELGHGTDDSLGKSFVESLSDYFEVGVVKDGRHVRCNIFEATVFNKPEYGD